VREERNWIVQKIKDHMTKKHRWTTPISHKDCVKINRFHQAWAHIDNDADVEEAIEEETPKTPKKRKTTAASGLFSTAMSALTPQGIRNGAARVATSILDIATRGPLFSPQQQSPPSSAVALELDDPMDTSGDGVADADELLSKKKRKQYTIGHHDHPTAQGHRIQDVPNNMIVVESNKHSALKKKAANYDKLVAVAQGGKQCGWNDLGKRHLTTGLMEVPYASLYGVEQFIPCVVQGLFAVVEVVYSRVWQIT
jgi:hypothetical protein